MSLSRPQAAFRVADMAKLFFGGLDPAFTDAALRRFIKDTTGLRTKHTSVAGSADRASRYGYADFKSPLEMLLALAALHAADVRARPVLRGTGAGGRGAEREELSDDVAAACWCASADDVPRAACYLKIELTRLLMVRGGFRDGDASETADAVVNHAAAGAPTPMQGLHAAMALLHYPECIAPWAAAALVKSAAATPELDKRILVDVARRLRWGGCLRDGHEMTAAVRDALLRGDAAAGMLRATLWWALRCAHGAGTGDAVVRIAECELAAWRCRCRAAGTQQ
jgi:hypothetical protein